MLALPPAARAPIARLIDATTTDDLARIRDALSELSTLLGAGLDVASRAELSAVIESLPGE
jgi:hypothetical protein